MMEESAAVRALGALAQDARLRVFRALVGAGPEGLTPGELSTRLAIPASTLSFHLRELLDSGLASVVRSGRQLHYRPELARMDALMAYLTDHCCNGAPCKPAVRVAAARRRGPATSHRKSKASP